MWIAVPNRDRLYEPTIELLERVELYLDNGAERKLYTRTVDPDMTVLFACATNIPRYARDGAAGAGIAGPDQVRESGRELEDLFDLECGKCRFVLAVPEDGDIGTVTDMSGKVVVTEFPHIVRIYLEEGSIDVEVVEVTGVTELAPHVEVVDAIIDITSTGTTLRVNRLTVIDEVPSSSVRLPARPDMVGDLEVRQLLMVLESTQFVGGKRYLVMNTSREKFDEVKKVIPDLGGPTVMDIAGDLAVAIHVVVDEHDVFEVVSDLRNISASGILVTETERLVE